jgi:hypothetical protein
MAELEPTVQTTAPASASAPAQGADSERAVLGAARLLVDYDIYETGVTARYRARRNFQAPNRKQELSELPGVVIAVHVKPGERVAARTPLHARRDEDAQRLHRALRRRSCGAYITRATSSPRTSPSSVQ